MSADFAVFSSPSTRLLLSQEVFPAVWAQQEERPGREEGFWDPGQRWQRLHWGGRAEVSSQTAVSDICPFAVRSSFVQPHQTNSTSKKSHCSLTRFLLLTWCSGRKLSEASTKLIYFVQYSHHHTCQTIAWTTIGYSTESKIWWCSWIYDCCSHDAPPVQSMDPDDPRKSLRVAVCLWLYVCVRLPGFSSRGSLQGLAFWQTQRPRASCVLPMMTAMAGLEQTVSRI